MGCGVWGGVDGCNSTLTEYGGCVWVSSIRGHIGVSRIKWVGRGSIGDNLLSIYIGLGNGIIGDGLNDRNGYAGHDSLWSEEMIWGNEGLGVEVKTFGNLNRSGVLGYDGSIGVTDKSVGQVRSSMMVQKGWVRLSLGSHKGNK